MKKHQGDLLCVERGIIVHGCNARGAMGAGVAMAVRTRYPEAYEAYAVQHARQGLRVGEVVMVDVKPAEPGTLFIANAVTQADFGNAPGHVYVDYDGLERCFEQVRELALASGLAVHFPLIGCGLAGGRWEEVERRIRRALGSKVEKHLWTL